MTNRKKKLLIILGTRPEAIKLAPVILEAQKHPELDTVFCSTGQHREMLDQVLKVFDIEPDISLDLMTHNQTLSEITASMLQSIQNVVSDVQPDWIVVQGDTATVFVASLVAFYNKIKIAHVEAGLRTHDISSPFPEEMNRRFCDMVADLYLTPTAQNTQNLLKENIPEHKIVETGNTVIDSLLLVKNRLNNDAPFQQKVLDSIQQAGFSYSPDRRLILITGHRRENFGEKIQSTCEALRELAQSFPDCDFVYPVHLNPNVKKPVHDILLNIPNFHLLPPVNYPEIVFLMSHATLIITDSGGIQEEAPSFHKPLIVTRESTERQEVIESSKAKLTGSDKKKIIDEATKILTMSAKDYNTYTQNIQNPFGTGNAAQHIINHLKNM